jgi:TorA maturation chaperone TorD
MSEPSSLSWDAPAKAALCALLARVFAGEPDLELLQRLRAAESPGLTWFEPELLALSETQALEALAVDYCRLFIGPQPWCPPYASAQPGDALLGGRPRRRLETFLARYGVPAPHLAWRVASPDHLAVELAILAHLYATDAPVAGLQEFLTQHVWPWIPTLLTQVEALAECQLYRTAARLGAALLGEERALTQPRVIPP